MSSITAAITAVGAYVPDYKLTNAVLETMVDTTDEWITTRTGIKERRILKDKEDHGGFTIRTDESKWEQGKFVHPHDACFDRDGNIYVAEWVATGRITKLTRA